MSVRWPRGDPRDVAHAILGDPRFHAAAHGPATKTWWDIVREGLQRLWSLVFGRFGKTVANDTVTMLVGLAVLTAAIALLVYVAVRFARGVRRARPRREAGERSVELERRADARTLRAAARAALSEGRYHDAAALLWLSALRALDEHGRVRYDATRTPGELRRLVADPAFDALADDAVVAFFGGRAVDEALVARMVAAYDRIVPA